MSCFELWLPHRTGLRFGSDVIRALVAWLDGGPHPGPDAIDYLDSAISDLYERPSGG
jgi:hypothetical protein